jgi:hypothetical protein
MDIENAISKSSPFPSFGVKQTKGGEFFCHDETVDQIANKSLEEWMLLT